MHVKRFADAKPYDAPNHRNYSSLRLFGAEAGGTKGLVFGYSHFLPGGGAGPDASPPEKVYFVLRGELTVIVNGKETVLKANDSCVIEPNVPWKAGFLTNRAQLYASTGHWRANRARDDAARFEAWARQASP